MNRRQRKKTARLTDQRWWTRIEAQQVEYLRWLYRQPLTIPVVAWNRGVYDALARARALTHPRRCWLSRVAFEQRKADLQREKREYSEALHKAREKG